MYSNPIREEEKLKLCRKCRRAGRVYKDGICVLVCRWQCKRTGKLIVLGRDHRAGECVRYERRNKNTRMPYLTQAELFARDEKPLTDFLTYGGGVYR